MEEGNGNKVKNGFKISMQYTVTFISGENIHNIKHNDSNIELIVGENVLPKQLENTITDMIEGERKIMIFPPINHKTRYTLKEKFPLNSWLVFDIKIISIIK